jgi:hypothetical protein
VGLLLLLALLQAPGLLPLPVPRLPLNLWQGF